MTDQTIATNGSGELRPAEQFIDYLIRRAGEDKGKAPDRNKEIMYGSLDAILGAASVEEMWDADELQSNAGKNLEDVEMEIQWFSVHEATGEFDAPLDHYVWVHANRLDNGAELIFNTSSTLIMGKLRYLEAAELLGTPEARCVIRGRKTANGRVLKLKPITQRAVQGTVVE